MRLLWDGDQLITEDGEPIEGVFDTQVIEHDEVAQVQITMILPVGSVEKPDVLTALAGLLMEEEDD